MGDLVLPSFTTFGHPNHFIDNLTALENVRVDIGEMSVQFFPDFTWFFIGLRFSFSAWPAS